MNTFLWFAIAYFMISLGVGIFSAKKDLAEKVKDRDRGYYRGDGSGRMSEEERIRYLAMQVLWPNLRDGFFWPIGLIFIVCGYFWFALSSALASDEVKAARRRDEEARTRAILEAEEKKLRDQFKGL